MATTAYFLDGAAKGQSFPISEDQKNDSMKYCQPPAMYSRNPEDKYDVDEIKETTYYPIFVFKDKVFFSMTKYGDEKRSELMEEILIYYMESIAKTSD